MIMESAILHIKPELSNEFEGQFNKASNIISKMEGYIKHELLKCIEQENQYILLVWWKTIEDHTVGFRKSPEYHEWKGLLHRFYDPFPTVEHYVAVET